MMLKGKLKEITRDYLSNDLLVTFRCRCDPAELEKYRDMDELKITVQKFRRGRSLDANALMWKCIGEIANAINADKWDVYLRMLKRYGKYTYICVKPSVVDAVKTQWRECEVVGNIDINGQTATQLLCYFGSSTYDTKEFSILLDGIISEMEEMGLEKPITKDMERVLNLWEQKHGK